MTTADLSSTPVAPAWWRQRSALAHIARTRAAAMYSYRSTMLFFLGVSIVQILMLRCVWGALYAARPGVLAIGLDDLVVYLTLANLISWSFPTRPIMRYLRERIREGSVVFDLIRPVGFAPQMVAQLVGTLCGAFVPILIGLPVVALAGRLSLPAGFGAFAMFVVSLVGAYAIAALLALLLAMVSFWTLESDGLAILSVLVSGFLSGALVPVAVFPGVLRTVVGWLPFQATIYVPASIYVGALDGTAAWRAVGVQLMWVVVLGAAVAVVWRRAMARMFVQGG